MPQTLPGPLRPPGQRPVPDLPARRRSPTTAADVSAYSASQDHHPDCPVHLGDSILCRCHDLGPVPTVKRARGTSNRLVTGSSYDRRRRRQWLLDTYGDGQTAPCALRTSARCLGMVDAKTLTVDRIIPGALGGSYRRENIRPACGPCNFGGGTAVRVLVQEQQYAF